MGYQYRERSRYRGLPSSSRPTISEFSPHPLIPSSPHPPIVVDIDGFSQTSFDFITPTPGLSRWPLFGYRLTMIHLGLIGCGSIGTFLLRRVNQDRCLPGLQFTHLLDLNIRRERLIELAQTHHCRPLDALEPMLDSDVQLVVEAATPAAACAYAPCVLAAGKHLLLMSAGALSEGSFADEVHKLAASTGRYVLVPSGAIGGLDAVRAAMEGGVDRVTLTTRKPPAAIEHPAGEPRAPVSDAPVSYIVFEGPASEAIRLYPKNINVSVTLGLSGLGPAQTQVRIVADPQISLNTHEVQVTGSAGSMRLQFENLPMPDNPKTSALAAYSALAALRRFQVLAGGGLLVG